MNAQNEATLVKTYKCPHSFDISQFLEDWRQLLTCVLLGIWNSIKWRERGWRNYYIVKRGENKIRKYYLTRRVFPRIPKSNGFKRKLRSKYLNEWGYGKHYVDSAIKTAYSILNSWRKRHNKGKARRKCPAVKRRFVRVKGTLFSYRNGVIRITIIPRRLYLEVDLKNAWFWSRIEGLELGEIILRESELIIAVKRRMLLRFVNPVGCDMNLLSMNCYDGKHDATIDLKEICTIYREYELKKKNQKIAFKNQEETGVEVFRKGEEQGQR